MTIAAYTGLPGHGKSYGVVENVIIPALKAKREVFTNIPMNALECRNQFGMAPIQFSTQDIIENESWWAEEFNAGALIVIDELWRLWPAGLKANNVREADKAFLAEHRHLVGENGISTEIIFVTQDLSQISAFARALVENTFRVTKLSKLGMSNKFRVDIYFGAVTGASPPKSKREREIYGKFKSDVFRLYKSHTKSETGEAGNEDRTDNRFNILKGNGFKFGIVLIAALIFTAWKGSDKLTGYYKGNQNKTLKQVEKASIKKNIRTKPRKKVFRFLADAEGIYISYNNGIWPKIDYHYKVVFDNSQSDFTYSEMQRLGYELEPINQCMVKIKGPDYEGFAMCERPKENTGWIEDLADTSGSPVN